MALFEEIDTKVRQMLADAGRTHPAKGPALIVVSLTSARQLRSDPRWRGSINHAKLESERAVETYLGTRVYEDVDTAIPWAVLTTSEAETYLREEARLRRPMAADLRALFIRHLRSGGC